VHALASKVSIFKFQEGIRFAHSKAAAISASVAAADSPCPSDRGSESPLSQELDSAVLSCNPRERSVAFFKVTNQGLRKRKPN
jgi:hypothetical protein